MFSSMFSHEGGFFMQKIKNISIIFLIFLLCLSNFFVISLASSVEVTKENLEQAFNDLMASNVLESAPDITFSDEYITISSRILNTFS